MTRFNDSVLNLLRQQQYDLASLEAQIKAARMRITVLADDRERSLHIAADAVMDHVMSEPTVEDQLEFDGRRFDALTPVEAFMNHVLDISFDIEEGVYES